MVQNKDPHPDNAESETLEYPVLNEIPSSKSSPWVSGDPAEEEAEDYKR